jgi:hypothetical protein
MRRSADVVDFAMQQTQAHTCTYSPTRRYSTYILFKCSPRLTSQLLSPFAVRRTAHVRRVLLHGNVRT